MMLWLGMLWIRFKSWIIGAALVVGALASVWLSGRRSGIESAKVRAAEAEQRARRDGDEAVRVAERDGVADRLRRGNF
jgi:hypothetical protein